MLTQLSHRKLKTCLVGFASSHSYTVLFESLAEQKEDSKCSRGELSVVGMFYRGLEYCN